VAGRRVFGPAPAYRDSRPAPARVRRTAVVGLVAALTLMGFQAPRVHLAQATDAVAHYVRDHR
jgi:hypothetical protein